MAKTSLEEVNGIPLMPMGMNDNSPLQADPDFYQTRGMHSISERCLQRMSGKSLFHNFQSPVLAIHGDMKDFTFIETSEALYLVTGSLSEFEP